MRAIKSAVLISLIRLFGFYVQIRAFLAGKRPVLFVRNGGIGDIICTFPAAQALKEKHPGCLYFYCCHPAFVVVPEMSGQFDVCLGVRHNELIPVILANKFSVYSFVYADEQAGQFSTEHMVDEFCRNHRVVPLSRQPKLVVSEKALEKARQALATSSPAGKLITIHIGPSWKVREWSCEKWQELIERFREKGFSNFVQLGNDQHMGRKLGNVCELQKIRSLPDLGLDGTAAAIQLSSLFIGIDSGLLHIAGAVSTPSLGLFGPTNPAFRIPLETPALACSTSLPCQFCHHRLPRLHWQSGCPNDIQCMREIAVEDVLARALSLLEQGATGARN